MYHSCLCAARDTNSFIQWQTFILGVGAPLGIKNIDLVGFFCHSMHLCHESQITIVGDVESLSLRTNGLCAYFTNVDIFRAFARSFSPSSKMRTKSDLLIGQFSIFALTVGHRVTNFIHTCCGHF